MEAGYEIRGPNPELLFAGAYPACYHGALVNAAKKPGTPIQNSTVRAMVSLVKDERVATALPSSYMRGSPTLIPIKDSESWRKLTNLSHTPRRCVVRLPSYSLW